MNIYLINALLVLLEASYWLDVGQAISVDTLETFCLR
jgi:hypothetical protein